jgi:anaerobic selenocysteine-containing dehydrogenase
MSATSWARSTCPHDCPSACALDVERLSEKSIGRVRGLSGHPYTDGVICGKVSNYAQRQHHPERLMVPLKRVGRPGVGRSEFVPTSWDEAMSLTAAALRQAAERHGPESVWPYFYAGTMGWIQRDGIERLRHVMGYSRQHSTICIGLSDPGWLAGAGVKRGLDAREIVECDLLVVWGGNPVNTQINVFHKFQQARRIRGTQLVVVDPYETDTARRADLHLRLRPGTDGALACAVMHVLFEEGLADWDYLRAYTDDPEGLQAHLTSRTPEWAAGITGLSVEEILQFARLYGSTPRSFLRLGYGFTRTRNGAVNMHAASCLPVVTGAWKHPGGGALYSNSGLHSFDVSTIQGLDRRDPSIRVLDQSRIGPILCGSPEDLQGGPPIHALFIQNTNPMVVAPDTRAVDKGMRREDLFICVHEQFFTETAAMADVVLPATTFLEHDDCYSAGGHTFFQVARAAVLPPGECRSNHQVIQELARRLDARHAGFEQSEWELVGELLRQSGLESHLPESPQSFEVDLTLGFREMHFLDGFGHPDRRFHFRADWSRWASPRSGMPTFPDHWEVRDAVSAEKPFRLITPPARWFLNSTFNEIAHSRERLGGPCAWMHPEDLEKVGLQNAREVVLGNEKGSLQVKVEARDVVPPGLVVVEGLWPNQAFPGGWGVNSLVSPEAAAPNGGAVFHDTAIWVDRSATPENEDAPSLLQTTGR